MKNCILILLASTIFWGCMKNSADVPRQDVANLEPDTNTEAPPVSAAVNAPVTRYFNRTVLEEIMKDSGFYYEDIVYNPNYLSGLISRGGGPLFIDADGEFNYNSGLLYSLIEYENYNILLLTERVDAVNDIRYLCDILILEKENPETAIVTGPVEINDAYFDWEILVVINSYNGSRFTDDISRAYKANFQTKKIEQFFYETIRLWYED